MLTVTFYLKSGQSFVVQLKSLATSGDFSDHSNLRSAEWTQADDMQLTRPLRIDLSCVEAITVSGSEE